MRLPNVAALLGIVTQWLTSDLIQPPDPGCPPIAADEIAPATPCTTMPNATIAATTAASRRHGRIFTTSATRIRP